MIQLQGQRTLVVGGGKVAERKVEGLMNAGAMVFLVARDLTHRLSVFAEEGSVSILDREFKENHLDGMALVIAATNEAILNHKVSACARSRGILVNAVDQPQDCSFIVPSVMNRGDLVIAVSTSGKSPALARRIREDLEERFGDEYSLFLRIMGALRERVLSLGLPQRENAAIFQEIVDSELLTAIASRDRVSACAILKEILPEQVSFHDLITFSRG
jgi:precorrin-2 dehydrogenase/sirohydrochlorin ferrochelatase